MAEQSEEENQGCASHCQRDIRDLKKLSQSSFKRTRKKSSLALGPSLLGARDDQEEEALATIASSIPKATMPFPFDCFAMSEIALGNIYQEPTEILDQSLIHSTCHPLLARHSHFGATPSFPIAAAVPRASRSLTSSMNGKIRLAAEADLPPPMSSAPIQSHLQDLQDQISLLQPIIPNCYLSDSIPKDHATRRHKS